MLREEAKRKLREQSEQIRHLYQQGQYQHAKELASQSCELARQVLGETHPYFISSLTDLGVLLKLIGNDEAAAAQPDTVEPFVHDASKKVIDLYHQGRYKEALDLANQSVAIAQRHLGEQHPLFAISLNSLAGVYKSMGNFAQAESLYSYVLKVSQTIFGENDPNFAASLNNLALLYQTMGKHTAAEALLSQSLEICRRNVGESHPNFATALGNLATLYSSMGDYDAAEPLYLQAIEIQRQILGEQHPELSIALNNLAAHYKSKGSYALAERLYRQVLEIDRTVFGEQHPSFATSLSNLASLYDAMGNYADAATMCRQSLEIWRRTVGERHPSFGSVLNNLSAMHFRMGDFATAEQLCRQAVELSRSLLGEEHPDFAAQLNNLAGVYFSRGDYAASEPLYRQALEIWRRTLGEEHPSFATGISYLAGVYFDVGNYAAAERLYQQALEIRRKVLGEQHPHFAASVINLARLHRSMGLYAQTEQEFRFSLEILRQALGDEHPDVASGLTNLAGFYQSRGNYSAAESLFQQALEIDRKAYGDDHLSIASNLNNLAGLYQSLGNYDAAEPLFRRALEVQHQYLGDYHPDLADSLNNLAGLLAATQRADAALGFQKRAAAIHERMMGQVFSIGSEAQRTAYVESIRTHLAAYLSLVVGHLFDSAEAVHSAQDRVLRRKAIGIEALAAQRDAVLGGKYIEVAPKLREITMLRAQIAQRTLNGAGKEGVQIHQQMLMEWNSRKEELEAETARLIPEMNLEDKLRSIDHQVVAMAIPVGTALIEFVRFKFFDFKAVPARGEKHWKPAHYLVFVMHSGDQDNVEMIDLGEAGPIDVMIATFRSFITGGKNERGLGAGSLSRSKDREDVGLRLREAIFDPLLKAIGDHRRLMISPDGDLARLPFEVLPLPGGWRLIDEYRISYLSAGRDVVRFQFKSNRKPNRSLVAADPDFDLGTKSMPAQPVTTGRHSRDFKRETTKSFQRLPGTSREGKSIATMLGAELWTRGEVLDAHLKQCWSPRILHLSTHGFFLEDQQRDSNKDCLGFGTNSFSEGGMERLFVAHFENPLLRSGLALAGVNTWLAKGELMEEAEDGLLTAEDVSGLDLLDTELVVLSACNTGLGEVRVGEGVFGLQRAFVLAGAKTMVMSLWEVPDEQTCELMEDFYRRLLAGEPRADALRAAQLAMKAKYPEPLYWGAFICQGNPGPLPAV